MMFSSRYLPNFSSRYFITSPLIKFFVITPYIVMAARRLATPKTPDKQIPITADSNISGPPSCPVGFKLLGGGSSLQNPLQNGAGSSALNVPSGFIKAYTALHPGFPPPTYDGSLGSGGGLVGVTNGSLDWAGSDVPPVASNESLLNFPIVVAGVAIGYNIPGFTDQLQLTPEQLAAIYDPGTAGLSSPVTWQQINAIGDYNNPGLGTSSGAT